MIKRSFPLNLVTVYLNYTGDNSGIILNPQKFRCSMPSVFGPDECSVVLTSILDSCIKCTFQPSLFISRIKDLFPTPNEEKKNSFTQIKCKKNIRLSLSHLDLLILIEQLFHLFSSGK